MKGQFQPVIAVHRIRAITLDLDNTLWEIDPVIYRAEETLWAWLGEHYPRIHQRFSANDLLRLRHEVMEEHWELHFDFRFLRKKVLEQVAVRSGYDASLVEPAFNVFDDVRNDVELYPDVMEELQTLFSRFTVVALTNGNSNLEKIGIRHLFHGVVTAVSAGAAKPEKRIFDAAAAETGVAPDEILHVGDHPETDIDGARQAGFRTAWINRNGDSWPDELPAPDATVADMTELRELLEGEA
jgi:2-haloalkanoic acid dehalogenase type II